MMKGSPKLVKNKKLDNKLSYNNKAMSTSSKIIENHIQITKNNKNSPKKSLPFPSSPQLTPRSKKEEHEDDDDSIDRQELLLLQIKQIKRQNKFLKKKIQDLVNEMNGQSPDKKKKNKKGPIKENIDSVHLTVEFFFEEINSLINGIVDLFKVQFTKEEVSAFQKKYPDQDDYLQPTKKYMSFKKFTLNRKLQKILLEKEEKRYVHLLDVFSDYYKIKEENEKQIIKVIDGMTAKAIDLNKLIVEKAHKKTYRSNGVKSQNHQEISKQPTNNVKLSIPFNIVSSPGSVISDNPNKKRGYSRPQNKF